MKINSTLIFLLSFLISCENKVSTSESYVDPHIIFSSRRWWNYDIFIADIYGGYMTQITKNKWIDFNPSISKDSKKISFISDRDGNREIYIADLEWMDGYSQWRAKNLENITNTSQHEWTPVFSPVEDKIAFSAYFPENDNYDIFLINDDGTEKQNITNTPTYEKYPQFSPDGSFIILQGWNKGKMEIFFISLLDKNMINITRNIASNDILPHANAISPDGQSFIFTSDRDGDRNIYLSTINGSSVEQITNNKSNDYEPALSPDGQYVAFTSDREGSKDIYLIDLKTKEIKNLTQNNGDDWNARFYPDGRKIIFQSNRDGNWEIYMMNLDGGRQINLTNHPSTDYSFIVLPLINP